MTATISNLFENWEPKPRHGNVSVSQRAPHHWLVRWMNTRRGSGGVEDFRTRADAVRYALELAECDALDLHIQGEAWPE